MTVDEWDGLLPRDDCWHWLIRRRDNIHCMGFYSRMIGWRVSDSIGRTVQMSPSKVARLYKRGGRVIDPFDLEVVMVGDCGFYVPKGIKEEIERLRRSV